MLAERAGIALDAPSAAGGRRRGGLRRRELLAVNAWAEGVFAEAPGAVEPRRGRTSRSRGIDRGERRAVPRSATPRASAAGCSRGRGGTGSRSTCWRRPAWSRRPADAPGQVRERFRGRLIFPIHDPKGRAIGFGGRVLPEVEQIARRVGQTCRKVPEQPRDAAVPEAPGALRGRPRPRRGPRGGLGRGGRGLHRRDRRAPGRASATSSAPSARPWATTTSSPSAAWPTASS